VRPHEGTDETPRRGGEAVTRASARGGGPACKGRARAKETKCARRGGRGKRAATPVGRRGKRTAGRPPTTCVARVSRAGKRREHGGRGGRSSSRPPHAGRVAVSCHPDRCRPPSLTRVFGAPPPRPPVVEASTAPPPRRAYTVGRRERLRARARGQTRHTHTPRTRASAHPSRTHGCGVKRPVPPFHARPSSGWAGAAHTDEWRGDV